MHRRGGYEGLFLTAVVEGAWCVGDPDAVAGLTFAVGMDEVAGIHVAVELDWAVGNFGL